MIYLAIALSGILLVLLVAVAASGWAGRVWYSWRRSRHVAVAAPVPEYRFVDQYGSMVLADEQDLYRPSPAGLSPAGWLRGLDRVLASTTTSLPPDPDEPYDPALDEPFAWLPAPEPTAAEVAASRAAHGYIPELDSEVAVLCAGCILEEHCDGAVDDCDCTCGFPENWADPDDDDDALMTSTNDSGPGPPSLVPPGPDPYRGPRLPAYCVPGCPDDVCRALGECAWPKAELATAYAWEGPEPTRLADTADVLDARLLADVAAEMRAQDDDAALYLSRLRSACAQYRLDLQAALA